MILLDREDVIELGMDGFYFLHVEWVIGSPEAVAADYADIVADGPFLLAVDDECAWVGQQPDRMYPAAQKRLDPQNRKRWTFLAKLYADSMGITHQGLVLRFTSMRKQVRRRPTWIKWESLYHWPEGADLAWSALTAGQHPDIEVREHDGRRQARYRR